ncbi:MAG: hypothetical protein ABTD50_20870 [Polyangiaceae bacterium]
MNPRAMLGLVTCAGLVGATFAHAEDAKPTAGDAAHGRIDQRLDMWRVELGYRGSFVTQPGYNLFSTQDYFSQVSLALSRTVFVWRRFSFAPGIAWDYGSAGATERQVAASTLDVHRMSVPLEARAHAAYWGYGFVRAAPGVAYETAEVDDPSAPGALTKSRWLVSADVSAGIAVRPPFRGDSEHIPVRPWLQVDVGYGWIAAQRLNLTQDTPSSTADFGTLAMQGAFFRLAVAASL